MFKRWLLCTLILSLLVTSCFALELPTPKVELTSGSPEFEGPFLEEGSEPIWSEEGYQSENICLKLSSFRYENSDVHVADIYVRTLDCLARSYPKDQWQGSAIRIAAHAEQYGALLAITGDSSAAFKNGLVIGNGVVRKASRNNKRDLGVLWKDGTFTVYKGAEVTSEKLSERQDEIWQTLLFGPFLLSREDGHALTDKEQTKVGVSPANPRSVFGYYEPGHYCFVLVDGRKTESKVESGKKNRGITLEQTAALMKELGVTQAYNLDGGQSAQLYYLGETISSPYKNGRRIGDVLILVEKPDAAASVGLDAEDADASANE